MDVTDLPCGESKDALEFPHFPTRQQAVIWRNWGLVSVEKLAKVLKATSDQIESLAAGMGLKKNESLCDLWHERGYLTIIRRNWHLLPYEQLLALLDWSADEMAYVLKEDDFLFYKLGRLKPKTPPVDYAPLSLEQERETETLRQTLAKYFSDTDDVADPPFTFLKRYGQKQKGLVDDVAGSKFGLKLTYSYSAVYGDPLLDEKCDPYPDGLLADYAVAGINAVWLQGVLYSLVPWLGEKYSTGWQARLANLKTLCQRAKKYGIKVYLYLNEPRTMPEDFFADHPDWRGVRDCEEAYYTLCTSQKPVRDALRDGVSRLFAEVPELGGVFTITMSENLTNCCSRPGGIESPCPVCSSRGPAQIVAEVNQTIAEGVHRVNPDADVIAWTWAWLPEWDEQAVELLPDDVKLMCVSETDVPTDAMGIKGTVLDYSISKVGPGPIAERLWKKARQRGLGIVAKVQLNNTWECSAVPFIPVPGLVEKHLRNLEAVGVGDLMVNWTLGGYPGGNMELLKMPKEELAVEKFGDAAGPLILRAWESFGRAFEEFPLHLADQLYTAPQNFGPMCLLAQKKTGYAATMIGFPYDDLDAWRGRHYPEDIFENQFQKLTDGWAEGLEFLKQAKSQVPADKTDNLTDLVNIAEAFYCHFRSAYQQIRYVRLRNAGKKQELLTVLDEEIDLARRLHTVMCRDSRIGFEASNHYYYTANDLKEKVLNCEWLKAILK